MRSASSTAPTPVVGLRHHRQVGLRVEHQPQAAAHDGVVVGEQDPRRLGRAGVRGIVRRPCCGTRSSTGGAARPAARVNRSAPADHRRPLAHAADARAGHRVAEPGAVVGHAQHDRVLLAPHLDRDARALAVAERVRERLLRDAVQHQLGVRVDHAQRAVHRRLHLDAGAPLGVGRQRLQGAREAEVVERRRPQPRGDLAQRVEAVPRQRLRVVEGVDEHDAALAHAVQLEHGGGEVLADLVVQLLRDAATLCLLRHQHAAHAVPPLVLETVEHHVEAGDHRGDLDRAVRLGADAGLDDVDRPASSPSADGSGRRLIRRSTAFATMVSTRPISSTVTSTAVTLRLTVTGVKMSAATAAIRIAALTASTRREEADLTGPARNVDAALRRRRLEGLVAHRRPSLPRAGRPSIGPIPKGVGIYAHLPSGRCSCGPPT